MTAEHHVQCDQQEENSERASKQFRMDTRGTRGSKECADEEAGRKQSRYREIDVSGSVVPERGEQSDWRQQHGERGALSLVLRESKHIDQQGNEDFATAHSKQASSDARQESENDEPHDH
jgi:hypothetical protein